VWLSRDGRKPVKLNTNALFLAFSGDAAIILNSIVTYYNGRAEETQKQTIWIINEFGKKASEITNGKAPESPSDWQHLILRVFEMWFKQTSKLLKTRIDTWNQLKFCLITLRDAEDLYD
jgi:hypothetical protein